MEAKILSEIEELKKELRELKIIVKLNEKGQIIMIILVSPIHIRQMKMILKKNEKEKSYSQLESIVYNPQKNTSRSHTNDTPLKSGFLAWSVQATSSNPSFSNDHNNNGSQSRNQDGGWYNNKNSNNGGWGGGGGNHNHTRNQNSSSSNRRVPIEGVGVPVPHLRSPAFAFTILDSINKSSVIPVLDHIVWAIMDLDLDCVSSIVDEEDDALLPTLQHC
ncbi:hypothetical protein Cgig2_003666 [Carnegiea gigantea]|uniref:Uncharacterized protein n=1 Tax=Carnegiea gigantea TaxID=171969 RepID=A0A9Q1JLQ6_9CARY|nr:hypothetical protein Cgig2_003666 [Carnegiea gigantea]